MTPGGVQAQLGVWKVVWVVQLEKIGKCFVSVLHVQLPLGIKGDWFQDTPMHKYQNQECISPLYKMA